MTEIYLHPSTDADDVRAALSDWPTRADDYSLLETDSELARLIEDAGAITIGYREIRDLQRAERSA